jgi:hypothetical protein
MSDPPQSPRPDGPPGEWEGLAFGSPGRSSRSRVTIGLLAAGVLVLAGVELGPAVFGGPVAPASTVSATPAPPARPSGPQGPGRPIPEPTVPPTALGVDPTFDRFARDCYGGRMRACDELYDVSAPGSRYEAYADSCAGRQQAGRNVYCTIAFPGG